MGPLTERFTGLVAIDDVHYKDLSYVVEMQGPDLVTCQGVEPQTI
jgi:hypothetical protein